MSAINSPKITNNNFVVNPKMERTSFGFSFLYLVVEVILPFSILFFLTSSDFTFNFHLQSWIMVLSSIGLLFLSILLTIGTYLLGGHKMDQFTYTVPFATLLLAFYLTSVIFPGGYFLVRFIIALFSAMVGMVITSIALLFILRKSQQKIID